GGLDCAGWIHRDAGRTAWTAEADAIPLRVTGAGTTARVEGFAIEAADAVAPGGSSIAVLVHEATVDLARAELTAGDGAAGAAGVQAPAADDAEDGVQGLPGCDGSVGVVGGGGGGQNTCQG